MTADDILSIQQAVAAYGVALDGAEVSLFERCFTQDAELFLVGFKQTVDEYVAQCQKAYNLLEAMHHHCATTLLDCDRKSDGSIGGRTPFVAYHFGKNHNEPLVIGGEYLDVFCRTSKGWRIARRTGRARWQMGDPTMLAPLMDRPPTILA